MRLVRAWVTLGACIAALSSSRSGAQVFKVGTFTKSTCTAPCSQVVPHGLGVAPTALVLWHTGSTTGTGGSAGYSWGFGASDGGTSRALGGTAVPGLDVGSSSGRHSAGKAIPTRV